MKQTYAAKHSHVRRIDGVVIIKLHGNLMGGSETDELEKLIDQFDTEGVRCLIVNLTDVAMMNSLAIGRLVSGHVRFKKRGANMCLCNLDKRIQNIFVITKLSLEFHVYPGEAEAIAACASGDA
jgi:anti-sigma B factor antagonist